MNVVSGLKDTENTANMTNTYICLNIKNTVAYITQPTIYPFTSKLTFFHLKHSLSQNISLLKSFNRLAHLENRLQTIRNAKQQI